MARSVTEIQDEIKTQIRTFPSLDDFKFPEEGGSATGVFNLIIFVVATAIAVFEILADQLKQDVQDVADTAISGNDKWLQAQMFAFQFGDTIVLTDFVPGYPVIDTTKQIITRASVKDVGSGVINIKVAKGVAPALTPLSAPELAALTDYYFGTSTTEGIGFAGVVANFISLLPDRMRVEANIYYLGQFVESTVKANVILAIDGFFGTFQNEAFDGTVFMIKLVDAIQEVAGVSRVELIAINGRPESVAFPGGTAVDIQGFYVTAAGYLISEDDPGDTLADTITMILESN